MEESSVLYCKQQLLLAADRLCTVACSVNSEAIRRGMTLNPEALNNSVSSALFDQPDLRSLQKVAAWQSVTSTTSEASISEGETDLPLLLPLPIVQLYGKVLVEVVNVMTAVS